MDNDSCLFEFQSGNDLYNESNISDLHAYYMTQFNLELESGASKKNVCDSFKSEWYTEKNYSHNQYRDVTAEQTPAIMHFDDLQVDYNHRKNNSQNSTNSAANINTNEEVYVDDEPEIDDEQIIMEELCKVDDNVSCRLSPDIFTEEFLTAITKETVSLPPMEKAFSKHYCNYTSRDASIPETGNFCNNLDVGSYNQTSLTINNLDNYSYPNNILNNLTNENNYVLPDTPTSSVEFSYESTERKISVCESLESDLQSVDYFDGDSNNLDDNDIFMNINDLGLNFDNEEEQFQKPVQRRGKTAKDKFYDERICLWEKCFERYPNQSTLVEHIERCHVNTHKGDEFCCMWSECARNRRPFNARYKLLIHMRVHSGHKPNRCHHPGCGKAFSRLENLKIHVRSHTGERPYACPAPHCRKAFSNSSDRAKHQRTHFNARPYACGAVGCGKRYTDPSSLRKHVKTHPHDQTYTHMHVYTPPPPLPKMATKLNMATVSPVKLHTIRSIRNKFAPEHKRNKMF